MRISLEEARRVAALASLEFDEPELEHVADEMSGILDYVDQLASVDLSDVPEVDGVMADALRPDEVGLSLSHEDTESNAPSMMHGHFVVPRVIGGE